MMTCTSVSGVTSACCPARRSLITGPRSSHSLERIHFRPQPYDLCALPLATAMWGTALGVKGLR
jgi:hypothetical protein